MLFILRLRSAIFAVVTSAEIIPSRQRGQFASSYIRIGEFVPELPRNPNLCGTPDPESHEMGSKIGPKHLVFWSFTGKHGGATPPPNKQETRKPRNKLPQESRKTCKNMVFLYTAAASPCHISAHTQALELRLSGSKRDGLRRRLRGSEGA